MGTDVDTGKDVWRFKNFIGGMCILVRNYGPSAGWAVQYHCLNYPDQMWFVEEIAPGTGYFRMRNKASGLCLVAQGYAAETQAFQYTCGYGDQVFYWY